MKRVKAGSWSAALTPEQREELMSAYHASEISVLQAAKLAKTMTGRPVTVSMFSAWYHNQRVVWMAERARIKAEEAAAAAPDDLDAKKSLAIRQAAFAATMDELSGKEIAALEKNEIARQKLELDREKLAVDKERLALDKAKFEAAQRKAAALDEAAKEIKQTGGLSPESLKKIEEASKLL